MSIHKHLFGLVFVRDTTRRVDMIEAVLNVLHSKIPNSSLSKLVGLTTDGTPPMTGKENGAMVLMKKHLQESDFKQEVISLR